MPARRDDVAGEGLAGQRVLDRRSRAREVAVAHRCVSGRSPGRRRRSPCCSSPRSCAKKNVLFWTSGPPKLAPQRCCVGVGVRVAALGAGRLLVVGEGVQPVGVEVVERRAVVGVAAALGGDDDAGEAAVLGAVGVREHLHLGDGVEAGGRVADRAEDRVRRGLAVLDVGDAVGAAAEELDVVAAAERRSGSAAGRTACRGCCAAGRAAAARRAPRRTAWLSSDDVVLGLGRDRDGLGHRARARA